jgi:hypothetical protein
MKLVINRCYGGFGLSREGILHARAISKCPTWGGVTLKGDVYTDSGKTLDRDFGHVSDVERHDPILVRVVEELGATADGAFAKLKVVEIPDGIEYEIDDYDGMERVAEKHRTWS